MLTRLVFSVLLLIRETDSALMEFGLVFVCKIYNFSHVRVYNILLCSTADLQSIYRQQIWVALITLIHTQTFKKTLKRERTKESSSAHSLLL